MSKMRVFSLFLSLILMLSLVLPVSAGAEKKQKDDLKDIADTYSIGQELSEKDVKRIAREATFNPASK